MGSLFKPRLSRPLPPGAVVENGVARWTTKAGKNRSAESRDGRIFESGTKWIARYRDGTNVVRTVPTGCKDESAARAVLAQLERRAEMVRGGVITAAEDAVSDHRRSPIGLHVQVYLASMRARGVTERHAKNQERLLGVILAECGFRSLGDVRRERVERWLTTGENLKRSARTRNTYLSAARWFLTWTVETDRILANPLAKIPLADEKADRRRQPRALTADEVERLMDAARRRPLEEARLFKKGWRKSQPGAQLRPETVAKLERLGRERALIYKTLVLTGLRLGELTALRVCDAVLDVPRPHLLLDARHEKNRLGSTIPLRADLAADLRAWTAGMPADQPLLRMGMNQVKVLNRDLDLAGIAKHDDRGRTVCVHSLRHTHATLMSRGGVGPRVVQAAMRHSTIDLTMQVYTDPRLLDVEAALDVLPALPLAPEHAQAS